MKYQYYTTPDSMKKLESFGFSWLEFVTSVPSPMFLVTSYKSNGKPNACMQSSLLGSWSFYLDLSLSAKIKRYVVKMY